MVTTFIRRARKHQVPSAILFMHLSKAFDKLVRQVIFGVNEAQGDIDTSTDILSNAGVDSADVSHLPPIIASNGGQLHQLKVPALI